MTKAMKDLSETLEALKKEKSVIAAERDALVAQTPGDLDLHSLNSVKQKLANREAVIESQTKNIQDFRERLRTKEVELRTLNERHRQAEVEWNKQISEITQSKSVLLREKELGEVKNKTLSEQLAVAQRQLNEERGKLTDNGKQQQQTTTAGDEHNTSTQLQQTIEKQNLDKTRLERELKMLNETLYSTVAARNKAIQENKSLHEQLQNEKNKFAAHELICTVNKPQAQEKNTLETEIDRLKSELSDLLLRNASAKDELAKLMAETGKLSASGPTNFNGQQV